MNTSTSDTCRLSLKWGTLKSWDFTGSEAAMNLLRQYNKLGSSASAMTQHDTPEQKELLCQMIDLMPGDIYLDWDGKDVSHEGAKRYVREYGQEK